MHLPRCDISQLRYRPLSIALPTLQITTSSAHLTALLSFKDLDLSAESFAPRFSKHPKQPQGQATFFLVPSIFHIKLLLAQLLMSSEGLAGADVVIRPCSTLLVSLVLRRCAPRLPFRSPLLTCSLVSLTHLT